MPLPNRNLIFLLVLTCFYCSYFFTQPNQISSPKLILVSSSHSHTSPKSQTSSSPAPSPSSSKLVSSPTKVSSPSPSSSSSSSSSPSPSPSPSPLSSSSTSASSPLISSSSNSIEVKVLNESPSPSPLPTLINSNRANNSLSSSFNNSASNKTSQDVVPRKPTFEPEELEAINKLLIDKPNFCDTDHGATTDLIVIVYSAIGNFAARQAIRETWGKFAVERGALLLFMLGNSNNQTLVASIADEDKTYSDILQGSFVDSYYNLTLKTLTMVKWVSVNCEKVKFVLKVDDDMFLNMQIVVDFSETRTFSKSIIGHIAKRWKPHRDPHSKWYVPMDAFNRTLFPNFATGPCYFISGDAAIPLIQTALKMKAIYLEDVFMTGIVAEAANVRRLNYSLMKNVKVKVTPCNFKRFMTSHKHSPSEIITLWNLVYDNIETPCEKPTSKSNPPAVKQAKKALMKLAKS